MSIKMKKIRRPLLFLTRGQTQLLRFVLSVRHHYMYTQLSYTYCRSISLDLFSFTYVLHLPTDIIYKSLILHFAQLWLTN